MSEEQGTPAAESADTGEGAVKTEETAVKSDNKEEQKQQPDDRGELLKNVTKLREQRRELATKLETTTKQAEQQALELTRAETELMTLKKDIELRDLQDKTLETREWMSQESREKYSALVGGLPRDDKFIERAADALHLATSDRTKTTVRQATTFEAKADAQSSKPETPSEWMRKQALKGA